MDDKLERILEEGIAGYAKSEPLAGIEERILARIRTVERPQPGLKGWWVALTVGVAGIAVMLLVPPRHEETRPVHSVTVARTVAPGRPVEAVRVSSVQPRKQRRRVRVEADLPKLAVFPTPSPLTAEERRLWALIEQDPEGTAEAFENLRKQNEPIEIAPLVIQPLEIGGGQ